MAVEFDATSDRHFLVALFGALNEEGIRYAVMRNHDTLPYSAGGSDVDILIHPADKHRSLVLLQRVMKKNGGIELGLVSSPDFVKLYCIGKVEATKREWWGIRLDLSFRIRYAGVVSLMCEDLVFLHSDEHHGVKVFPCSAAATLGVLKELLHNDRIPGRYLATAAKAAREEWERVEKLFSPMGSNALSILREACLMEPDGQRIKPLCRRLRYVLQWRALKDNPLKYSSRRLAFQWSRITRVLDPPGMTIALLGTDGSGKSTLISTLVPILEAATHGAFCVQHLRPGLLPPLARLKGKSPQPFGPVTNPHGSRPSGVIGSLLRLGYLLADYVLGYWVKVRPVIAKSPTVYLFDRYAYDMEMDPRRFRIRLPTWLLRWATRLAPKPDLIFCLDGDPEVIASRKNELSLEEVRRQVQFLRGFAAREPNAVLISTDCSVEETRDQVLEALLEYCRARNPLPSGA